MKVQEVMLQAMGKKRLRLAASIWRPRWNCSARSIPSRKILDGNSASYYDLRMIHLIHGDSNNRHY